MKYVYLATFSTGCKDAGALTYSRKTAFGWAKQSGQPGRHTVSGIFRLSYGYYKDCRFCMDIPTFRVVGEKIL